jgi:hypothetical protein
LACTMYTNLLNDVTFTDYHQFRAEPLPLIPPATSRRLNMKLIQKPTEVGGPGRLALIFAYAEIGVGALSLRVNTSGDFAPRYEGDVGALLWLLP